MSVDDVVDRLVGQRAHGGDHLIGELREPGVHQQHAHAAHLHRDIAARAHQHVDVALYR